MLTSNAPSNFPISKPNDSEDVHWALSTAQVLWKRNDYGEALDWLRKAADAASDAEDDLRVIELAKAVSELTQWFESYSQQERSTSTKAKIESASPTMRPPLPRRATKASSAPPPSTQIVRAQPQRIETNNRVEQKNSTQHSESEQAAPSSPRPTASWRALHLEAFQFEALSDVPDSTRESMLTNAELVTLLPDEEMPAPTLLIVAQGEVQIHVLWHSMALDYLTKGQVCWLGSTSMCNNSFQIRAGSKGARVFAIPSTSIDALETLTPWFLEELKQASDEVHMLAGALKGAWASSLTPSILKKIWAHSTPLRLVSELVVVKQNEPVHALILVGGGSLLLRSHDSENTNSLQAGDVVFPQQLARQELAPQTAYAAHDGALVRVATRASTELLFQECPELIPILLSIEATN